jgi:aminomethyltransferase
MVRIYPSSTPVRKSIEWRSEPISRPVMTTESPFHSRTSLLTDQFTIARDLWSPRVFDGSGAIAEYWACREKVTVQDMSGLRKLDIAGPDAERLLQQALTRDVRKLSVNRGFYGLICDQRGSVIDDGTLFRLAPDVFRWCCGLDDSAIQLRQIAEQENLSVWITDLSQSLCNLAVQGPLSAEVLQSLIFTQGQQPDFTRLKWFGFTVGRLFDRAGHGLMVTRSGFTGEKGYEIFCDNSAAEQVWDAVIESGSQMGIHPMGGEALNMLRLEAGLMIAGAEFGDEHTPCECGLSFAVDLKKGDFIGRAAIERDFTTPRKKLVGLRFETSEAANHGDQVFIGRRGIGTITSSARSPQSGKAIAMARLAIEETTEGQSVEVGKLDGHMKRIPAVVCPLPFEDPQRLKPRA